MWISLGRTLIKEGADDSGSELKELEARSSKLVNIVYDPKTGRYSKILIDAIGVSERPLRKNNSRNPIEKMARVGKKSTLVRVKNR